MIQEFLVISPRGDTLIAKNYLGTVNRLTADTFLRRAKAKVGAKGSQPPPVFQVEGVTYCYVQTNQMYFVVTTLKNCQAAMLVELLQRLSRVFKDYLGVLTEESVRRNFLLLYELLDEVFDCGYPQGMSTELLKAYVYNDPVAVNSSTGLMGVVSGSGGVTQKLDKLAHTLSEKVNLGVGGDRKTMASAAANKPIHVSGDKKDNTMFVDVIERLTAVLDSRGIMTQCYINGSIVLKSFVAGSPEMRIGLNDGVTVTSLGIQGHGSSVVSTLPMEDATMHECVRWDDSTKAPVFTFYAPDGEFTLLTYRIKSAYRPPIVITPFLEADAPANALDYVLRVRAEFAGDKSATHVSLVFALPSWANSVSVETASPSASVGGDRDKIQPAGKAEFDRKTNVVTWNIPKMAGGTEAILRAKIVLGSVMNASDCALDEFGLVRVNFELPMLLLSGVSIKFLDFLYTSGKTPNKWIRYVTQAHSYVARWS